jgi:hypothetical protein
MTNVTTHEQCLKRRKTTQTGALGKRGLPACPADVLCPHLSLPVLSCVAERLPGSKKKRRRQLERETVPLACPDTISRSQAAPAPPSTLHLGACGLGADPAVTAGSCRRRKESSAAPPHKQEKLLFVAVYAL